MMDRGLTLAMIVKNESRWLDQALTSARRYVDQIVVVDTGSTDDSITICRRYGARVESRPWVDFAAGRNQSLGMVQTDMILILDPDELYADRDHAELLADVEAARAGGFALLGTMRNYLPRGGTIGFHPARGEYGAWERGAGYDDQTTIRVVAHRAGVVYDGEVHEGLTTSLERLGIPIKGTTVPIHHYGYLDETHVAHKARLYYDLIKRKVARAPDYHALVQAGAQAAILRFDGEAVCYWKRALLIEGRSWAAWLNLTACLIRVGDVAGALTAAQAADRLAVPEAKHETAHTLGLARLYTGDAAGACEATDSQQGYAPCRYVNAIAQACTVGEMTDRLRAMVKDDPQAARCVKAVEGTLAKVSRKKKSPQAQWAKMLAGEA